MSKLLLEAACDFHFGYEETLLSREELICCAPTSATTFAESRCSLIKVVEEKLFNQCFGWAFYLALIKNKIKYTTNPNDEDEHAVLLIPFQQGEAYEAGTCICFDDKNYIIIKDIPAGGTYRPPNAMYFKIAPKFYKQEYNYIWNRYLKDIVGYSVMHSSVLYRLIRDTNEGLVKNYTDGSSTPADLKELCALRNEMLKNLDTIIYNMECFVERHPDCFEDYKKFENCEEGCQTNVVRHYGFNV